MTGLSQPFCDNKATFTKRRGSYEKMECIICSPRLDIKKEKEHVFNCQHETEMNKQFLLESLDQAQLSYEYDGETLMMHSEPIQEEEWISILNFQERGHGGFLWFRPGQEEPKIQELDTFICGIVRQPNRLRFYTNGSCDGHGRQSASVSIVKNEKDMEQLVQLLLALGMKRVHYRENT